MGKGSNDGGAASEKVTTSCCHQWEPLYLKPTDIKFLELWYQSSLETWHLCSICGAIGRRKESGKLQMVPASKLRSRRVDAALGNGAGKIWQNLTDI